MKINKYLPIVILICIGFAFATAEAQENRAQEVYAIFEQNCLNCHGAAGAYKDELLIERTALVDTGVVIPGDPEGSEFYKRLLGPTENGAQMPLNLPSLSPGKPSKRLPVGLLQARQIGMSSTTSISLRQMRCLIPCEPIWNHLIRLIVPPHAILQ